MRALITGINGFVGGHLAEHLLATGGWELSGVARQPGLALSHLQGSVAYLVADLSHSDEVVAVLEQARPDVIFHLAAQSNVRLSFDDPEGTLLTNILPQMYLFQALLRLRQSPLIIVVGSNEIYGQVQPDALPINEDTPLRPVSPYAVSKATQDLLAYQYHISHQLRTIRLRAFNHIGPRQSEQFVASAFAAQIARIEAGLQEPMLRVGNLSAERDFTDVRDMVRAYAHVATSGQPGAAYNIGSGRTVSIRWLLDTLIALSEYDIATEPDTSRMRPADVPRVECDSTLFRRHTNWAPQIALEETLYDILEHWRRVIHLEQPAHSTSHPTV
jgi:GDP-4-dehydro-6-deoxy-D-mannose reductase